MKTQSKILIGIWIVVMGLGLVGLFKRLINGHQDAAYGSYIVWGLWVSAYIYFSGLSAGSFLLSAMITVFRIKKLEKMAHLALFVAFVTLIAGLLSIWFDLGRMGKAYRVITSPNFHSIMAWMIWMYQAYAVVLVLGLWLALRPRFLTLQMKPGFQGKLARLLACGNGPLTQEQEDKGRHWLRVLTLVGIPLAIAFNGGVGALFSTVSARPLWHSSLMPILFLSGALLSGSGLMLFVISAFWPRQDEEHKKIVFSLGSVVIPMLIFYMVMEWAEFSVPLWYQVGGEHRALSSVLFGEFWWVFWILHIGLGMLLPFILMVKRKNNPVATGLAGLLIASTFFTVRLNIVIPALVDPNLQGLQRAFTDHRLTFQYVPNFFEWQVVLFVVGLAIALFFFGWRYLPLQETGVNEGNSHGRK